MSIEPHIKSKNALAGLYGATASSLVCLLILIYIAITPVVPGDDASIRGAAILVGTLPPIWVVLFIYFFAISFKTDNRLRFAFSLQLILALVLSVLLAYVAFSHEGWAVALPVLGITFLVLTVVMGVGSWCSTFAK